MRCDFGLTSSASTISVAIGSPARMQEAIKWMWSLGDYREVAPYVEPHAEALINDCGITAGMDVLDVGTGNGHFAALAAHAGLR
jgi:tRNA A58 N-methylase Trm61